MVGRQLPLFSVIVPFWLVAAFAGWRGMVGVWPAILVAGVPFAVLQFLVSNLHGPWLVDVVASIASMASLVLFLRVWRPRDGWDCRRSRSACGPAEAAVHAAARGRRARVGAVDHPERARVRVGAASGEGGARCLDDGALPVPGLHNLVLRVPPVVPHADAGTGGVRRVVAVGDRHRHPDRRDRRRARAWAARALDLARTYARTRASGAHVAAHDRRDAALWASRRATRGSTRRSAWRSRAPACSTRSSARCSGGSASR